MADLAADNVLAVLAGAAAASRRCLMTRARSRAATVRRPSSASCARSPRAIDGLELPAVEKISESQPEDPFQVLIATLLSARTQDATTLAASTRLFKVARTPRTMARLTVKQIERLIYPVSFYRNKARHVKATCRHARRALRRPRAGDDGGAADAAGRRPQDGEPRADPGVQEPSATSASTRTCTASRTGSAGCGRSTPDETEQALYRATDARWWPYINLYLVTWGQNVCRPVYPRCGACAIRAHCPQIGVERRRERRATAG